MDTLRTELSPLDIAWAQTQEGANNFRFDTFAKPSWAMLEAIIGANLGDGDNDQDSSAESLQRYVADLVGHETGLIVGSGTMGNQVAHRAALTLTPYSILADSRGHFHTFEAGGASLLWGAHVRQAVPVIGHYLTLEDIKREATLRESIY